MTFRTANLIHCRLQQGIARVSPRAKPLAATLVAAVLFFGASALALADRSDASIDCAGLTPISLTAGSESSIRTDRSSPTADCSLSLELGQLPPTDGGRRPEAEPCVVTATPSQMGNTGVRVRVRSTGNCDRVEIRLTTNVNPRLAQTRQVQAASSGYAAASAKLIGQDPGDLVDMFYNKSQVSWGYTATTVNSGSHYPSDWVWSSLVWSVTSRYSSLTKQAGDVSYQGYNRVKFKALQNTRADTKAVLTAKPGGAFSCTFSIKWTNKPIGFNHDTECDTE